MNPFNTGFQTIINYSLKFFVKYCPFRPSLPKPWSSRCQGSLPIRTHWVGPALEMVPRSGNIGPPLLLHCNPNRFNHVIRKLVPLCNNATRSHDWIANFYFGLSFRLLALLGLLGLLGLLRNGRLGHDCLLCVNKLIFIMESINT